MVVGTSDDPPSMEAIHEGTQITGEIPNMRRTSKDSQPVETTLPLDQICDSDDGVEVENGVESDDEDVYESFEDFSPASLPMPDMTEFDVPLPPELQNMHEVGQLKHTVDETPVPLASPPSVIHVPGPLKPLESIYPGPSFEGIQVVHLGREAGLSGTMQATYLRLPPGTRTTRMHSLFKAFSYEYSSILIPDPVAQRLGDSLTYCISGQGLLWQNGWTFHFVATDAVGWKGGTGIAHTIINDSNHDGSAGQDLVLLIAHEVQEDDSFTFPLNPEIDETMLSAEGNSLWKDAPIQGELGPHPGVPSVSPERGNMSIPEPQKGYRPSNVVNAIAELDAIGEGELFANATSLTQETGLSRRFGCNFEVPPPGTRSSGRIAVSFYG